MTVIISDHDPAWPDLFARERPVLEAALGACLEVIEHIGSTSVPGLAAKPVIDVLVGVDDIAGVDTRADAMREAGYEVLGENGLPGRRYFRKRNAAGERLFHVHVYASDSEACHRHLVFRDYLRAQPGRAAEYGAFKRKLAAQNLPDRASYVSGKADLVARIEAEALDWAQARDG